MTGKTPRVLNRPMTHSHKKMLSVSQSSKAAKSPQSQYMPPEHIGVFRANATSPPKKTKIRQKRTFFCASARFSCPGLLFSLCSAAVTELFSHTSSSVSAHEHKWTNGQMGIESSAHAQQSRKHTQPTEQRACTTELHARRCQQQARTYN